MKSKRKPCKGDIWEWYHATNPTKYLLLAKADVGKGWWVVLELETGEQCETLISTYDWKFIS